MVSFIEFGLLGLPTYQYSRHGLDYSHCNMKTYFSFDQSVCLILKFKTMSLSERQYLNQIAIVPLNKTTTITKLKEDLILAFKSISEVVIVASKKD